jgi:acetyl-CoA carboxylase biotin carboxyl carrier protein
MEPITQEDLFLILKLMEESNYDELHLEMGDLKLNVKRKGTVSPFVESRSLPGKTARPIMTPEEIKKPSSVSEASDIITGENNFTPIKASMLGTFYRAPKPGAPPFVDVGQDITADDTVCLIEVMKLFNAVKAGVSGRIAKICAKDGEMVEYQQTLFLVEEAGKLDEAKRESA